MRKIASLNKTGNLKARLMLRSASRRARRREKKKPLMSEFVRTLRNLTGKK
jgi:hypothetical protein